MPKRIIIDTDPAMGTKGGDPEDCFATMLEEPGALCVVPPYPVVWQNILYSGTAAYARPTTPTDADTR